ncbi:MAG: ATP-binding cassette domain-containing protein [Firmicutes bacterium]|nr:ATP-binding cassette domain-containing protein [Bacillota bacterium]
METFEINNFSFSYPMSKKRSLKNINLNIKNGEFILICGQSGSGKTTLLKNMKNELAPHGKKEGEILYNKKKLSDANSFEIGFVMQNPENQIVTDTVWHELAFGLENMGLSSNIIRRRVAEISSFLGIADWFRLSTNTLSGGQKQKLCLASVMVMQPKVLILDEPLSQLDPIAATEFIETLKKINNELGMTIIISEHRLEDLFAVADKVVVMDNGSIILNERPRDVSLCHPIAAGFPAAMRIYTELGFLGQSPITVKEGRRFIDANFDTLPNIEKETKVFNDISVKMKNVWFKYGRELPDVLKGVNLTAHHGEILCIVGANATGKSTALSVLSGVYKPHKGQIELLGKRLRLYNPNELYGGVISLLPQSPQTLFVHDSVEAELYEMSNDISQAVSLLEIEPLLKSNPFDISCGEQQKVAFAKILLKNPQIILLDEPTKGLDSVFKAQLAKILNTLSNQGKTIIIATHDLEFAASYAHRCAMFFDGVVISHDRTSLFLSENNYYTTAANRIVRHKNPYAITVEDVISLCKKS